MGKTEYQKNAAKVFVRFILQPNYVQTRARIIFLPPYATTCNQTHGNRVAPPQETF